MLIFYTLIRIFIGPILFFIFFNCGPKPQIISTENQSKNLAEKANNELITETGDYSKVEKNLSGVTTEVISVLSQPITELEKEDFNRYKFGEPGWIKLQKKKRFSDDMSPKRAKENLLSDLRNEAVNKKMGTSVEVTQLLTDVISANGDEFIEESNWSGFFRSTVTGIITDEKQEKKKITYFEEGEGFDLDLEYSFYVEPVTGQRDPGFWIEANLESDMLKEGSELVIRIIPSMDSYVYIFNLMADNNAMLMFPNEYMMDNNISAGNVLIVPDPKIQKYVSFIVGTMAGQKITSESVYIICTKQKIPIIDSLPKIGQSEEVFSDNSHNFLELQRWLTKIPLNQRIEKALLYHVSK